MYFFRKVNLNRKVIVLTFIALLMQSLFPAFPRNLNASTLNSYEAKILHLINEYRKEKGLSALRVDPFLQDLALKHSQSMARIFQMSHAGFDRRAQKIFNKVGAISVAENVAYKQQSAKEVVSSWINSHEHRKNLEGKFNLTGLSAIKDKKGHWVYTNIFAAKR